MLEWCTTSVTGWSMVVPPKQQRAPFLMVNYIIKLTVWCQPGQLRGSNLFMLFSPLSIAFSILQKNKNGNILTQIVPECVCVFCWTAALQPFSLFSIRMYRSFVLVFHRTIWCGDFTCIAYSNLHTDPVAMSYLCQCCTPAKMSKCLSFGSHWMLKTV